MVLMDGDLIEEKGESLYSHTDHLDGWAPRFDVASSPPSEDGGDFFIRDSSNSRAAT
jgi:hypothetical protein